MAVDALAIPGTCVDRPNDEIWKEIWDGYIPMLTMQYGFLVAKIGFSCLFDTFEVNWFSLGMIQNAKLEAGRLGQVVFEYSKIDSLETQTLEQ